ncbi:MAG: N-acetylmuramoyl-L-alanine amidase [Treponema sp.]|nr:N-acetylmuramoyl-L-alanine amidase [Treponema sp.]
MSIRKTGALAMCAAIILAHATAQPVNLAERAARDGMTLYWDPLAETGLLEKNGHQISFRAGDGFVLHDYSAVSRQDAPYVRDGELLATKAFLDSAEAFFRTESDAAPYKIGAILIDPGHGGKDPGANDTHTINGRKITVREKDVNLSVGLKLYDYLRKSYPDKKILMTRSTDVFISLAQRTEIANSVKLAPNEAILYVSVHVNASLDKKASGYEVWYLTPGYRRQVLNEDVSGDKTVNSIINGMLEEEYTTESILIARFITDGIAAQVGSLSSSRGIKAEEWFVVRNANMPSVLVETGFLTNPGEAALLADDKYLQKLSLGIYNGLQAFVTHFERSRGFTTQTR